MQVQQPPSSSFTPTSLPPPTSSSSGATLDPNTPRTVPPMGDLKVPSRHSRRTTAEDAADVELETMINEALDLQDIVKGLIERAEAAKTEYKEQASSNSTLLKYINNLIASGPPQRGH
ncbi:hypothetical protein HDV05_008176 [Chytridiales sp. JEL 0842]|nr:hypothetical protein HDV05_008176 [Chytridiales sp. JEL 0842]